MELTDKTPVKKQNDQINSQVNSSGDDVVDSPREAVNIIEVLEGSNIDTERGSPIRPLPMAQLGEKSKKDLDLEIDPEYDENFLISFDDSSDEEDGDEEIPKYNIVENWKSFSTAWPTFNIGNFAEKYFYYQYAFLSHALGVSILYSNSVNQHVRHYKKEKMLIDHEALTDDSFIKKALKSLIHKQIADIFDLGGIYKPLTGILTDNFIGENNDLIEGMIISLSLKKRSVFQYANTNKPQNKEKLNSLFKEEITKLIRKVKAFIQSEDTKKIIYKFIPNLSENHVNNIIRLLESDQALAFEISNRVDSLVQSLNQNINNLAGTIIRTPQSGARIKGDPSNIISQLFPDFASSFLWNSLNDKYIDNTPAKNVLIAHKKQYTFFRIREAFRIRDYSFLQQSQTIMNVLHKNGYVTRTVEDIIFQINDQIPDEGDLPSELIGDLSAMTREFIRSLHVERKTLPLMHKFNLSDLTQENFTHKFLGSIRIANLSNKRKIKNFNDKTSSKAEGSSRFDSVKGWIFPSSEEDILDFHQFTLTDAPKRQDEVSNLASYKKIYEKLNSYKFHSQLSEALGQPIIDQLIAHWLERIISGDSFINSDGYLLLSSPESDIITKGNKATPIVKRFLHDLTKLAYLLFGCEAARNPASLVHNMMIIDLVKKGFLTLEQALSTSWQNPPGGLLPMTRTTPKDYKTTIDLSRIAHSIFFEYMPHSYLYDNKEIPEPAAITQIDDFISREYWIVHLWLNNILSENNKKKFLIQIPNQQYSTIVPDQLSEFYRFMLGEFQKRYNNIDLENLWYTSDQINHLLQYYLANDPNVIALPPVAIENEDALFANVEHFLEEFGEGRNLIIPLNINNNHWVGAVLRHVEGNHRPQLIYVDPRGEPLSDENRGHLERIGDIFCFLRVDIVDLALLSPQQTNGYDCGPITINNLVRLAMARPDMDLDSIRDSLITHENTLNIRDGHQELLSLPSYGNNQNLNPERLLMLLNQERGIDSLQEKALLSNAAVTINTSVQEHDQSTGLERLLSSLDLQTSVVSEIIDHSSSQTFDNYNAGALLVAIFMLGMQKYIPDVD